MAKINMAWPNVIDSAVLSGGSWQASLPLANVQNRRLSKVARTVDTAVGSTVFKIDRGISPTMIDLIALVGHNMSVSAEVLIRGYDDPSMVTPIYTSGWIPVWPSGVVPLDLLEWEGDNFWLGTLSQNALAGYRAPFTHYMPSETALRYWYINIDDTGNSDGYAQIGRVFIGESWSPEHNASYGMSLGYADATTSETSLTGEEFFDVRTRYRVHKFDLPFLSKEEAFANILTMQQQLGTSGELLISVNRDDAANTPRTCFLGRMQSISPVVTPWYDAWTTSFEIREIL